MIGTVLVLPTPRALLPPRSVVDPVSELRAACHEAVAALPQQQPVIVLAAPVSKANADRGITEPLGHRVARSLLGDVEFEPQVALPYAAAALLELAEPATLLVMADGSACRSEKAPGHLHPDAIASTTGSSQRCARGTRPRWRRSIPSSARSSGARACRVSRCSVRWHESGTSRPR